MKKSGMVEQTIEFISRGEGQATTQPRGEAVPFRSRCLCAIEDGYLSVAGRGHGLLEYLGNHVLQTSITAVMPGLIQFGQVSHRFCS